MSPPEEKDVVAVSFLPSLRAGRREKNPNGVRDSPKKTIGDVHELLPLYRENVAHIISKQKPCRNPPLRRRRGPGWEKGHSIPPPPPPPTQRPRRERDSSSPPLHAFPIPPSAAAASPSLPPCLQRKRSHRQRRKREGRKKRTKRWRRRRRRRGPPRPHSRKEWTEEEGCRRRRRRRPCCCPPLYLGKREKELGSHRPTTTYTAVASSDRPTIDRPPVFRCCLLFGLCPNEPRKDEGGRAGGPTDSPRKERRREGKLKNPAGLFFERNSICSSCHVLLAIHAFW